MEITTNAPKTNSNGNRQELRLGTAGDGSPQFIVQTQLKSGSWWLDRFDTEAEAVSWMVWA